MDLMHIIRYTCDRQLARPMTSSGGLSSVCLLGDLAPQLAGLSSEEGDVEFCRNSERKVRGRVHRARWEGCLQLAEYLSFTSLLGDLSPWDKQCHVKAPGGQKSHN